MENMNPFNVAEREAVKICLYTFFTFSTLKMFHAKSLQM